VTDPGDRRRARILRGALVWLAYVGSLGLLLFSYRHLDRVMTGLDRPWLPTLVCEMTSAVMVGALYFPVAAFVRHQPWTREAWARRACAYFVACLAFCVAHTTAVWGMRALSFAALGLGDYDYGEMPLRYVMEAPMQVLGFGFMVVGLHAVDGIARAREREVRLARLQSSLAHAHLDNLRLQLQPHFLFNALNTISATMYRDPLLADELVQNLGDLLRASLRTVRAHEVPLADELDLLGHYVALQRARFGDGLRVELAIAEGIAARRVPSMLLQPLVENAVRHGNAARTGRGEITIRAAPAIDGRLCLEIEDDGPGASAAELEQGGVGLSTTRARLQLLYGDAQSFTAARTSAHGFRVRIVVPGEVHDP
jgi:two-component system, LytTR family, sensor kinase